MEERILEFLSYLNYERGSSNNTLSSYEHDLRQFVAFLAKKKITEYQAIKKEHITEFVHQLTADKMASSSIMRKIAALKSFF